MHAIYAVTCYLAFFASFVYFVGFVTGIGVPKAINDGATGSIPVAILIDTLLIAVFGLQHSVMARPAFKRWITRLIPEPTERSTYLLMSSLALFLLFWMWRPLPEAIWSVQTPALQKTLTGISLLGFGIVFYSTLLIDHFALFGLRQTGLAPGFWPERDGFVKPGAYKLVRHPLYLGFLIAFWATPNMTWGHLLFAALNTAYVFIAIPFEERDLVDSLGDDYQQYREDTPMILPLPKRRA